MVQRLVPSLFWTRGGKGDNRVFLTFDDGPNEQCTASILDTLRRFDVRASFFVVGQQVAEFPDIARRIKEEGHAVGLHGYLHVNPKSQSAIKYLDDVERAQKTVQSVMGQNLRKALLRPPYGYLGFLSTLALILKGYRIAMWSVDSLDFSSKSPDELLASLSGTEIRGGDILLFHDDCENTAAALPFVIERLLREGFRFGALDT